MKRVSEFSSRVVTRSVKTPSHFEVMHVPPAAGHELPYNIDVSSRTPSQLKEVVANHRAGLRESGGQIKPHTTGQSESMAKSLLDAIKASSSHCGLLFQVLISYLNCVWADHEFMQATRRLRFGNKGTYSGCSDVRTYSVKEELNACYNHAISASSGRSLLLRVNETEYQSVLDVISILCGSQPTYQLRDVKAGEQQPYVCNWSAESLSLHVAMVHEQTAPSTFTNLHQRMRSGVQVFDRQTLLKRLRIVLLSLTDPDGLQDAVMGLGNILVRCPGLLSTEESGPDNPPLLQSLVVVNWLVEIELQVGSESHLHPRTDVNPTPHKSGCQRSSQCIGLD